VKVAEEATGQEATQPTSQDLNPSEAIGILAQAIEAESKPAERNDKGQFTKAETEEAKPEKKAAAVEEKPQLEDETEAQPEPRKLKLKYKGEEKELLEPEVVELAQKGYDYTQKMQQLAKERDDASAKVRSEQEAARKSYEAQLETHKKALQQISGVKSMQEIEALSKTDPVAAQQEFLRALSVNQAIAAIEGEQAKAAQQREAESREKYQKQAVESVERLQERIPGWSNDLYGKILKTAVDQYGFQQQEANAITDHRAIEVLNDARQWREYQAAKPKTVEKRVAQVPKVQKPGTAEKPSPDADRFEKSMAKLNKTGKRDDAVDIIRQMIESGRM
jgi:hypothetical protein